MQAEANSTGIFPAVLVARIDADDPGHLHHLLISKATELVAFPLVNYVVMT